MPTAAASQELAAVMSSTSFLYVLLRGELLLRRMRKGRRDQLVVGNLLVGGQHAADHHDLLRLRETAFVDDGARRPDRHPDRAIAVYHRDILVDRHAGEEWRDCFGDVLRTRGLHPGLAARDRVGPLLREPRVLVDPALLGEEHRIVSTAHFLADRRDQMDVARALEPSHVWLVEDAEVADAGNPRPVTRRHADIRDDVLHGIAIDATLLQHIFEIELRRAAGTPAHDLLAVDHRPVELVDLPA